MAIIKEKSQKTIISCFEIIGDTLSSLEDVIPPAYFEYVSYNLTILSSLIQELRGEEGEL